MNGCTRSSLTLRRSGLPPTDHWLLANTPITQCPGVVSKTTVGPARTFPCPRIGSVADGTVKTGPTPQIKAPGCVGDKNSDCVTSPMPFVLLSKIGLG